MLQSSKDNKHRFSSFLNNAKDLLKDWLLAFVIVGALVFADVWPEHKFIIYTAFITLAVGLVFYYIGSANSDLRKPVNYKKMVISDTAIAYEDLGGQQFFVRFDEIERIEFLREEAMFPDLYGPYIESKWFVMTSGKRFVEIMDEWPHRKQLLTAFKTQLECFDIEGAERGLAAHEEGRWLCFQLKAK